MHEVLEAMRSLQKDWNSYNADPPSEASLEAADGFIGLLQAAKLPPDRIAPSAVGGVGVSLWCHEDKRRVYVEFMNNGDAYFMLTNSVDDVPYVAELGSDRVSVVRVIAEYLERPNQLETGIEEVSNE